MTFVREGETLVSYNRQAVFLPREMADAIMDMQYALANAQKTLNETYARCTCNAPKFLLKD